MGATALSSTGADRLTLWCINDASKSSVSGLKGPGAASKSRLGRCHLPAERAPKVLERLLSRIRATVGPRGPVLDVDLAVQSSVQQNYYNWPRTASRSAVLCPSVDHPPAGKATIAPYIPMILYATHGIFSRFNHSHRRRSMQPKNFF